MSAKDLVLRPIKSAVARDFIRAHHYSGKSAVNAQLHIGAFLNGRLEGAMQLGPPLDRSKLLPLVRDAPWSSIIELNRMAFSDKLPRNSESRALGVMFRVLRAHAPHVKWVVSFADATQCGDGTIYRAAGFLLTKIKKSTQLFRLPSGEVIHHMTVASTPLQPRPELDGKSFYQITGGRYTMRKYLEYTGATVVPGYQLQYIKFVDPAWRSRLTVEPIPYSEIAQAGATMYRGQRPGGASSTS